MRGRRLTFWAQRTQDGTPSKIIWSLRSGLRHIKIKTERHLINSETYSAISKGGIQYVADYIKCNFLLITWWDASQRVFTGKSVS
jgi:hypothetical protein